MASLAFDTHGYYKDLVDAGMNERHAEAIAVGVLRAHEMANLATKADVQMAVDVAQAKTDAKIDKVNSELNAKIDKVNSELNAKIDKVDAKIDQTSVKLEARSDRIEAELKLVKWMLGFLIAGTVAIIAQNFFSA